MTTIELACAGCGRTLKVGQEHAGKMARCPVCSHITAVPADAAAAAGAPVSAAASAAPSEPAEPAAAAAPAAFEPLWYMRTPEGQEYGPAARAELDRWVAEGRVTHDCQLRAGDTGAWQNANAVYPALAARQPLPTLTPLAGSPAVAATYSPFAPPQSPAGPYAPSGYSPVSYAPTGGYRTPHRGALILVLGLMGLFIQCPIFPIIAWVMGSNDLREMEAGRMDPSGRDMTRVGMILGMVLSILWILGALAIFGLFFLAALSGN